MASQQQVKAAKQNIKKARAAATKKKSIAHMPAKTRSALGKQGPPSPRESAVVVRHRKRARSCTNRRSGATFPAGPRWAATSWRRRSVTSRGA
jgi:hypothetical protein